MEAFARSNTRMAAATALPPVFAHLRGDRQKRLISTNSGQP
jgi:hypothetical protein